MSITVREQPGIPEEHLRACFQKQYDLIPITLEFLPVGHDYNAGVYRVVSEQILFFRGMDRRRLIGLHSRTTAGNGSFKM